MQFFSLFSKYSWFFVFLFFFPPFRVFAGIPVIDASNVLQSTISAIEAVRQTKHQFDMIKQNIDQYQNMIKNTIAPAAWIWGQATNTIRGIEYQIQEYKNFFQNMGGIEKYLERYRDISWYQQSPCFTKNGCSEEQKRDLWNNRVLSSQVQKEANKNLIKNLETQQKSLQEDNTSLENLISYTQSAQGENEAIGYGNQIAGQQAGQLLQIRSLLVAEQNVQAARMQSIADKEAQETAAAQTLREGEFSASPHRVW